MERLPRMSARCCANAGRFSIFLTIKRRKSNRGSKSRKRIGVSVRPILTTLGESAVVAPVFPAVTRGLFAPTSRLKHEVTARCTCARLSAQQGRFSLRLRHVQGGASPKKRARDKLESGPVRRHHRPLLGPRQVSNGQSVPRDYVRIFD